MGAPPLSWSKIQSGNPWLCSPHLKPWQKKIVADLKRRVPKERGLVWLLSSGTQSVNEVKAIALSHQAILASAQTVNTHLDARKSDRWLLTLPLYHIGGLAILARAHLSHSPVVNLPKWSASDFAHLARAEKVSLCSLVPTQVHDLVNANLSAPAGLRAVVVGGGALDPGLYARARRLGWPLLPSYGLTECASQVATAGRHSLERRDFPEFKVLSHVELELREQRIFLRSPSLCQWIARGDRDGQYTLEDPLREGWLPSEDLGEWRNRGLCVLGRRDDVVKVLGVLVPIPQVEHEAREFFRKAGLTGDLAVVAVPGEREGHRLVLVTDSSQSLKEWERQLGQFNLKMPGPQRLKQFCWVESIPRGELGKVQRATLLVGLRLC